jgi:hypothetical protein
VRRLPAPAVLVPLLLATTGVALILVGQLAGREPELALPSLSAIPAPSRTAAATGTPAATPTPAPTPTITASRPAESPTPTLTPTAAPTPTPTPLETGVATQLSIEAVGINVTVTQATTPEEDDFPPLDGAYILRTSAQPGRGTNSYIFAHAREGLFLSLWNVQLGDVVRILMSSGNVLEYRVTEVRPNTPCQESDPSIPGPPNPPLPLQRAPPGCDASWLAPTPFERVTLQTSQGPNRNYGEFIVVAEPIR